MKSRSKQKQKAGNGESTELVNTSIDVELGKMLTFKGGIRLVVAILVRLSELIPLDRRAGTETEILKPSRLAPEILKAGGTRVEELKGRGAVIGGGAINERLEL